MLGMAVDAGGRNGFVDELNLLGLHDMNGVFSSFGSSFGAIKATGNQIDFSAVNRLVKNCIQTNKIFLHFPSADKIKQLYTKAI